MENDSDHINVSYQYDHIPKNNTTSNILPNLDKNPFGLRQSSIFNRAITQTLLNLSPINTSVIYLDDIFFTTQTSNQPKANQTLKHKLESPINSGENKRIKLD